MTYLRSTVATINTDNATGDAFSRLRVSSPEYVFDAGFEYDLQPLLFEQVTAETGASIAHESTERSALLTSRYPITLDAAGAVRANGTLTLLATGIGATSTIRAALSWREVR